LLADNGKIRLPEVKQRLALGGSSGDLLGDGWQHPLCLAAPNQTRAGGSFVNPTKGVGLSKIPEQKKAN